MTEKTEKSYTFVQGFLLFAAAVAAMAVVCTAGGYFLFYYGDPKYADKDLVSILVMSAFGGTFTFLFPFAAFLMLLRPEPKKKSD